MKLSRRAAARLFAAAALMPSPALLSQPDATPQFDVTSVKPSRDDGWPGIDTSPGRIRADCTTVYRAVREAYDLGPHQLLGGPGWAQVDRWEIVARADRPVDDDKVLMLMLRGLLADRFKLVVHRETRNLPAYLLEVNKSGPRMRRAAAGDSDTEMHGGRGGPTTLVARRTDMNQLADILGWRMDREVVNRTGLQGSFDFTLHWAPDTLQHPEENAEDVSIFEAVAEQLGLRLQPAKAPVNVLIIDHVERPSEN